MIYTVSGGSQKCDVKSILSDKENDYLIFNANLSQDISHIKLLSDSTLDTALKLMFTTLRSNRNMIILKNPLQNIEKIREDIKSKRLHVEPDQYIFASYFLKNELLKKNFSTLKSDLVSYQKIQDFFNA